MNARTVSRVQFKYTPLRLPTRPIARFPVTLSRPSPPQLHTSAPRPRVARMLLPGTIDPSLQPYVNGKSQFSKRTPDQDTSDNLADSIERHLQEYRLTKWGLVIYRCTYQSNRDWEAFMAHLYDSVREELSCYNGLDLLDSFAPTVIEDPSTFTGATTFRLRDHFKPWARRAFQRENPHLSPRVMNFVHSARYRFFVMVDQECLESVLNEPERGYREGGHVRLVIGRWKQDDEGGVLDLEDPLEPLEGYAHEYVGWMNVFYHEVMIHAFLDLPNEMDWIDWYERPPKVQGFIL